MPTSATYASSITYWPNLMVTQVTHGNGVVDTQANDPNAMRRPQSIAATFGTGVGAPTLWKTDNYVYDGAGNITQIGAGRFLYDRVSRLDLGLAAARHAGLDDAGGAELTPSTPSATSSRSAAPAPATRRRARRPTA